MGCIVSCCMGRELQDFKTLVRDEFDEVKRILSEQPNKSTSNNPEKVAKITRHSLSSRDIERAPLLHSNDVNEGELFM